MGSRKYRAGFTLVEIMIVVAIIGIAAMIAIPSFMSARKRSQTTACKSNQRIIFEQLNCYCLDRNLPCTVDFFPDIKAVQGALCPTDGNIAYIKSANAFICPGNDIPTEDDYRFVRDGRQIVDIECDEIEEHNED